jgi:hypothetical protein
MENKRVIPEKFTEDIAYWYFRLNGFLTIKNFVVHPDYGNDQKTDADILGVRFPYRKELLKNPMDDDPIFTEFENKPHIVLAEVKRGICELNTSWKEPENKIFQSILTAIGALPDDLIDEAACVLHADGIFEKGPCYVSLFLIGNQPDTELQDKRRKITQITWCQVLAFIHYRFKKYRTVKSSHCQWDEAGRLLWDVFDEHQSEETKFIAEIKKMAGIQAPGLLLPQE